MKKAFQVIVSRLQTLGDGVGKLQHKWLRILECMARAKPYVMLKDLGFNAYVPDVFH